MSYILDALKKSEQERQRGSVPSVQSLHGVIPDSPRKRPRWPYLVLIALLMNAGLLLWWLQPWQSAKSPRPGWSSAEQRPAAAAEEVAGGSPGKPLPVALLQHDAKRPDAAESPWVEKGPPSGTVGAPARKSAAAGGSAPENAPEPEKTNGLQKVAEKVVPEGDSRRRDETGQTSPGKVQQPGPALMEPPKKPALQAPRTSGQPPAAPKAAGDPPSAAALDGSSLSSSSPGAPDRSKSASPPEAKPDLAEKQRAPEASPPTPRPAPEPSQPPKATEARPPAAPEQRTVPLNELPTATRSSVPNLVISFLAYSEKPAERLVNINGKMLREGQEVVQGLKLEQIMPDGVIFSYRGHRFQKGVF
jgi:general secretion pathway protein B